MKWLSHQRGFTLVEVIIVFAVGALLLTLFFAGESNQRNSAQFTTTIDLLRNKVDGVQNQARHGVFTEGGLAGMVFYGKMLQFQADGLHTWTIVGRDDTAAGVSSELHTTEHQLIPYAAGTTLESDNPVIIFTHRTNAMYAYNSACPLSGSSITSPQVCAATILNSANHVPSNAAATGNVEVRLRDDVTNFLAILTFMPSTNSLERIIQ